MEAVKVHDKYSDEDCIRYLAEQHSKSSYPTCFYVRPAHVTLFDKIDRPKLERLQEMGLIKLGDYVIPGTGESDPSRKQIDLLPAGMQAIQPYRISQQTVTTTTTQTRLEPIEAETSKEKQRQFWRTERGHFITTASLDSLLSDVKSHVQAIRNPNLPNKDRKAHQIWLRLELLSRGNLMPEPLRHEAEDCRDLPLVTRRKKSQNSSF
jgi:hypothetical protein